MYIIVSEDKDIQAVVESMPEVTFYANSMVANNGYDYATLVTYTHKTGTVIKYMRENREVSIEFVEEHSYLY